MAILVLYLLEPSAFARLFDTLDGNPTTLCPTKTARNAPAVSSVLREEHSLEFVGLVGSNHLRMFLLEPCAEMEE
jgi:hypothetical protein